jgi:hypothetical protein
MGSTMTDDLTAFVKARLDEDERELKKDPPVGLGYANLSARVRREIAAKRAILAEHTEIGRNSKDGPTCNACVNIEADPMFDDIYVPYPCKTVRLLAAVYSDHPGYRPEWAPEGATDGT